MIFVSITRSYILLFQERCTYLIIIKLITCMYVMHVHVDDTVMTLTVWERILYVITFSRLALDVCIACNIQPRVIGFLGVYMIHGVGDVFFRKGTITCSAIQYIMYITHPVYFFAMHVKRIQRFVSMFVSLRFFHNVMRLPRKGTQYMYIPY